ncbi:hypothetical protein C0991_002301 [Blastosporella zonata]|nr:hypothetical protein C0991_002301 [Blastosporella zonata]
MARFMSKGMNSGTIGTMLHPRDIIDLRDLRVTTAKPLQLKSEVPLSKAFREQVYARHLQEQPPNYRTRTESPSVVMGHEGLIADYDVTTHSLGTGIK